MIVSNQKINWSIYEKNRILHKLRTKAEKRWHIEYCLWVDVSGDLYVQTLENDASGSFSKYLFSVSKYESKRATSKALDSLEAYNIETKKVIKLKS